MKSVPSTDDAWDTAPFEAQYLKLYDVTAPPAVTGIPAISSPITITGSTTLSWNAVTDDPEGIIPTYRVTATSGSETSTIETTSTSAPFTGLAAGKTYTFTVTALNPNDTSKTSVASTSSPSVRSLTASGDEDNDGQNNADELIAGTDPLNPSSRFAIKTIEASPGGITLTWTAAPGKTYTIEAREDLSSGIWVPIGTGTVDMVNDLLIGSYIDSVVSPSRKFYRLKVQ
jgi:hypothetical protein